MKKSIVTFGLGVSAIALSTTTAYAQDSQDAPAAQADEVVEVAGGA